MNVSRTRRVVSHKTRNDGTIVAARCPKRIRGNKETKGGWRERFNFSVIARQVWRVPDSTLSTRRPRSIRSRVGPRPSKPTFRGVAIFLRMFHPPHSAVPRSVPFHPLFSDFFSLSLTSVHETNPNDSKVVGTRVDINRAWQLSRFDLYTRLFIVHIW